MEQSIPEKLAEQGVLAGIFDEPKDLDLVMNILTKDDFLEPRNAHIYDAMVQLAAEGKAYDPVSVASHLEFNGLINQVGGIQYLTHLLDPTTLHTYDIDLLGYSLIVKEHSRMRQVRLLASKMADLTRPDSGYTADEAMTLVENEVRRVTDVVVKSDATRAGDMVYSVLDAIEERGKLPDGGTLGVPTGFIDLDNLTTGWKPGQMIIVAGRPGQGKTTIALDFCRTATLKAGMTAMFFSLEMSKDEVLEKIIAAEARIETSKLKKGKLSAEEWQLAQKAAEAIEKSNLIIDDSPKITLPHIRAAAVKQKARPEGLDILFIDYLQLLSSGEKVESRQQEVSNFSRQSKLLAKELGVPVVVLSQLNRSSEQRADKSPSPSDLRESGSLEQDADIILLIHRPEYYDPNDRPGQAILNLAKHRNGPTENITLISLLQYSKFANGTGMISAAPPVENSPGGATLDLPPVEDYSAPSPDDYAPVDTGAPESATPAW